MIFRQGSPPPSKKKVKKKGSPPLPPLHQRTADMSAVDMASCRSFLFILIVQSLGCGAEQGGGGGGGEEGNVCGVNIMRFDAGGCRRGHRADRERGRRGGRIAGGVAGGQDAYVKGAAGQRGLKGREDRPLPPPLDQSSERRRPPVL